MTDAPGHSRQGPGERQVPWTRRLSRCALGVSLAVGAGWLIIVAILAGWGWVKAMSGDLVPGTSPWGAAKAFGFFGAIIAAPLALFLGVPLWLIADQRGLNRATSGAIAGAAVGVVISFFIPFLMVVLPFVGTAAGFLAVYATNRILPKY